MLCAFLLRIRWSVFLAFFIVLYLDWYLLYEFVIRPLGFVDRALIDNLEFLASGTLELLGFTLIQNQFSQHIVTIGIDGTSGLWIGDPCNGLTLFALFTVFVLAYPGPMLKKLWFIPVGLLAIHLINLLRILALVLIVHYYPDPEVLDFNHNYTFTVIVYGFIFFLWYWWAEKMSGVKVTAPKAAAE